MSFDRFKSKILNPTSAVLRRFIGNSVQLISGSVRTSYLIFWQISSITSKVINAIIPPPMSNLSKAQFKQLENIKPISFFAPKSSLGAGLFDIKTELKISSESPDLKDSPKLKTGFRRNYKGGTLRKSSYLTETVGRESNGSKSSFEFYSSFKQENREINKQQSIDSFSNQNYGKRKETCRSITPIYEEACPSPYIFSNSNSSIFGASTPLSLFNKEYPQADTYSPQMNWGIHENYTRASDYRNETCVIFSGNNQCYSAGFHSETSTNPSNEEIPTDNNDDGVQRKRFKARRLLAR
ncbi:unnamed protein product [Blepharisma stoltei]|uniref:Uncharacterized protein n=1 Tax=Blepharisma stoltei TaxID=1481888 RepID=A0AAU9J4D0_9CILI|nr:unnamed protein product [Blepharisma stoltei]